MTGAIGFLQTSGLLLVLLMVTLLWQSVNSSAACNAYGYYCHNATHYVNCPRDSGGGGSASEPRACPFSGLCADNLPTRCQSVRTDCGTRAHVCLDESRFQLCVETSVGTMLRMGDVERCGLNMRCRDDEPAICVEMVGITSASTGTTERNQPHHQAQCNKMGFYCFNSTHYVNCKGNPLISNPQRCPPKKECSETHHSRCVDVVSERCSRMGHMCLNATHFETCVVDKKGNFHRTQQVDRCPRGTSCDDLSPSICNFSEIKQEIQLASDLIQNTSKYSQQEVENKNKNVSSHSHIINNNTGNVFYGVSVETVSTTSKNTNNSKIKDFAEEKFNSSDRNFSSDSIANVNEDEIALEEFPSVFKNKLREVDFTNVTERSQISPQSTISNDDEDHPRFGQKENVSATTNNTNVPLDSRKSLLNDSGPFSNIYNTSNSEETQEYEVDEIWTFNGTKRHYHLNVTILKNNVTIILRAKNIINQSEYNDTINKSSHSEEANIGSSENLNDEYEMFADDNHRYLPENKTQLDYFASTRNTTFVSDFKNKTTVNSTNITRRNNTEREVSNESEIRQNYFNSKVIDNITCTADGKFPHPNGNTSLYYCCVSKRKQFLTLTLTCPTGSTFNTTSNNCVVSAPDVNEYPVITSSEQCKSSGKFASPTGNCSQFYVCMPYENTFIRREFLCPAGSEFNRYEMRCTIPEKSNCSIKHHVVIDTNKVVSESVTALENKEENEAGVTEPLNDVRSTSGTRETEYTTKPATTNTTTSTNEDYTYFDDLTVSESSTTENSNTFYITADDIISTQPASKIATVTEEPFFTDGESVSGTTEVESMSGISIALTDKNTDSGKTTGRPENYEDEFPTLKEIVNLIYEVPTNDLMDNFTPVNDRDRLHTTGQLIHTKDKTHTDFTTTKDLASAGLVSEMDTTTPYSTIVNEKTMDDQHTEQYTSNFYTITDDNFSLITLSDIKTPDETTVNDMSTDQYTEEIDVTLDYSNTIEVTPTKSVNTEDILTYSTTNPPITTRMLLGDLATAENRATTDETTWESTTSDRLIAQNQTIDTTIGVKVIDTFTKSSDVVTTNNETGERSNFLSSSADTTVDIIQTFESTPGSIIGSNNTTYLSQTTEISMDSAAANHTTVDTTVEDSAPTQPLTMEYITTTHSSTMRDEPYISAIGDSTTTIITGEDITSAESTTMISEFSTVEDYLTEEDTVTPGYLFLNDLIETYTPSQGDNILDDSTIDTINPVMRVTSIFNSESGDTTTIGSSSIMHEKADIENKTSFPTTVSVIIDSSLTTSESESESTPTDDASIIDSTITSDSTSTESTTMRELTHDSKFEESSVETTAIRQTETVDYNALETSPSDDSVTNPFKMTSDSTIDDILIDDVSPRTKDTQERKVESTTPTTTIPDSTTTDIYITMSGSTNIALNEVQSITTRNIITTINSQKDTASATAITDSSLDEYTILEDTTTSDVTTAIPISSDDITTMNNEATYTFSSTQISTTLGHIMPSEDEISSSTTTATQSTTNIVSIDTSTYNPIVTHADFNKPTTIDFKLSHSPAITRVTEKIPTTKSTKPYTSHLQTSISTSQPTSTTSVTVSSQFQCTVSGKFPNPYDNTTYFVCSPLFIGGFKTMLFKCPIDSQFYEILGQCATVRWTSGPETTATGGARLVRRSVDSIRPFQCATEGRFHDTWSCKRYHICTRTNDEQLAWFSLECPRGMSFDPLREECRTNYSCGEVIQLFG